MNILRLKEVAKKNHQLAVQGATYMLILLKEPDWEISASDHAFTYKKLVS
jgi:hypothetical protein